MIVPLFVQSKLGGTVFQKLDEHWYAYCHRKGPGGYEVLVWNPSQERTLSFGDFIKALITTVLLCEYLDQFLWVLFAYARRLI